MKSQGLNIKPLCLALIAAGMLAACGGGGSDGGSTTRPGGSQNEQPGGQNPGGQDPGGQNPGGQNPGGENPGGENPGGQNPGGENPGGSDTLPAEVPASATMVMACPEDERAPGTPVQCSGSAKIRDENGITLTDSGVQAYGRSTSDLETPNPNMTYASGFAPTIGGLAEVRINKDANGTVSNPALLLSNLNLSWDGKTERPLIIETFTSTAGRVTIDASGKLSFGALPPSSNLEFYNFATLGFGATQANYANNRYFPRTEAVRCPTGMTCGTTETSGFQFSPRDGSWRTGGSGPDVGSAARLHEDGDVHAGDGPNGTLLDGAGGGHGVPFPGSKGYRSFDNWSLKYANLGTWGSQDTVLIAEWANQDPANNGKEHNKARRGVVAYGDVTAPATIPTTGTAVYEGKLYGWFSPDGKGEPDVFEGTATVTANFATREVSIAITNAVTHDAQGTPLPALVFTTTTHMGAAGTKVANYMTGKLTANGLTGGIGARYFGPVAAGAAGPEEVGGTFTLSSATTGATFVGGFLGRRK